MTEPLRAPRVLHPTHPLELLWMSTKEAPMTDRGPGVLVLCTGNSARSQMAEAFLRRHGGDRFAVYSAGTEPAAAINPLTVEVMRERGIDLSGSRPKHLREYLGTLPIHTVIIVCDSAARSCPAVWPGARQRLFWPFDDPTAAAASDADRLERFRRVRDAIEARVVEWLEAGGLGAAATD